MGASYGQVSLYMFIRIVYMACAHVYAPCATNTFKHAYECRFLRCACISHSRYVSPMHCNKVHSKYIASYPISQYTNEVFTNRRGYNRNVLDTESIIMYIASKRIQKQLYSGTSRHTECRPVLFNGQVISYIF